MTSAHLLFIPGVLLVGVFLGFILGSRAQADRANLEQERQEERAKARAARAERKAQKKGEKSAGQGRSEHDS